jgi:hypothetical protein
MARYDGEELTAEDVQQLCGAMMMLGRFGNPEPFRIRNTPEATLEMEAYLAWVATHFAAEISCLDQVSWDLVRQYDLEGLEGDERSAAVMRDLLAFIEGYDDRRQLRLFT